MFCITGWIESESSHPFGTPADNWTWTWFGVHICRQDIRLIIFWNIETIVKISCRKQTGISVCLTLGVTILDSTTEIKIVLYYQCTVVVPVWSDKASVYLHITLVLLTALYMHLIYPAVESEDTYGWIYTFKQEESPRRV